MKFLPLTLFLLFVTCTKEDKKADTTSDTPLMAVWQLQDMSMKTEIAGASVTLNLEEIISLIVDSEEVSETDMTSCLKSIQMEFTKTEYKMYTFDKSALCDIIKEASGTYTDDGKKITYDKEITFAFDGLKVKEVEYTISNKTLTMSVSSEFNGIQASGSLIFEKQ